jgi:signal transduction histidine kinase
LAREHRRLAWAREQAVHAAQEIRQLILALRPSVLDDLGLVSAVHWYAGAHLEPLGVRVRLDAPETPPRLPPAVQTAAFRVLQEAMANVAKHAGARQVHIQLKVDGDALIASVRDDGQGFDPAAVQFAAARNSAASNGRTADDPGPGFGLLGMQERVALLGGYLTVQSQPGAGTLVQFRIPIPSSPSAPTVDIRGVLQDELRERGTLAKEVEVTP